MMNKTLIASALLAALASGSAMANEETDELRKIIENREDVIKHLEEQLVKGKAKKLW